MLYDKVARALMLTGRPAPEPQQPAPAVDSIVHRPDHYTWVPNVECKDVTKYFAAMPGAALKYIWRHGRKLYAGKSAAESAVIDLRKAVECLEIEIARLNEDMTGEIKWK